jgi:uncharacterized protein (TIGR00255 family)
MTGFASISRETGGVSVGVTVKSVNHRFLDIQIKAPAALAGLESRIKSLIQQRLTRGRVEIALSCDDTTEPTREVSLNEALVSQVQTVVDAARAKGLVSGSLTASDLLRIPHALEIRLAPAGDVPDAASAVVAAAVTAAIAALVVMRETEGGFLAADLDRRVQT